MIVRLLDPIVDAGAVFAGWVGLGMALVVVMAFALIIPVQTLVLLFAPLIGILIGVYANVRSERWRPRARVIANAAWAGLVTGLGIAVLYVVIRFVFIYGDSGALPDGTRLQCDAGPACVYQRLLIQEGELGEVGDLASGGIIDGATLEAAAWRDLIALGGAMVVLTVIGGVVGGAGRSLSSMPGSVPLLARSRAE